MKVDSDIDVEEDMSAGHSWNYILMKPWSFCLSCRYMENRVSKICERALRLVYDDSRNITFEELLVKGNSISIHKKISKLYLQKSLTQNKGFHQKISDLLQFIKKPYNFRNNNMLQRKNDKTIYFGTECISSLAPKIWDIFPRPLKNEICLHSFKLKIRFWVTNKCPCWICKRYVGSVGFTVITGFIWSYDRHIQNHDIHLRWSLLWH